MTPSQLLLCVISKGFKKKLGLISLVGEIHYDHLGTNSPSSNQNAQAAVVVTYKLY